MTTPILKPSPVDIVPASTAEAIVAETQRELTAREEERVAAEAAADAAERGAAGGAGDLAFHQWMNEHLERFVTLLRDEHDREMRSMVDAAERRAQACIERAQVDADMLTSYAHALRGTAAQSGARLGIGTGTEPAPDVEPVAPLVWRPSETHIDVPAAPAAPPPVVAAAAPAVVVPPAPPVFSPPAPVTPVPPAPAMTVPPPPVVVPPPAPVVAAVPVVIAPPAPAVPEASIVTGEVPAVAAVPVVDAAGAPPPPPAPPVAGAPAPVPAVGDTKDQSHVAKLKEFLHGLPTFAILQVLAVIVVLIIVLIRIG